MFLFTIILIGAVLTVSLMGIGLFLMQQAQAPRRPTNRLTSPGLELPPASSPLTPPPDLQWQRPSIIPWALTRGNASLSIGLGIIWTLPILMMPLMATFWVGVHDPSAWPSLSPFVYVSWLPFLCGPLLISMGMLIKGVRNWQKVKALEARGQLTRGVLIDRWSGFLRGSDSVAYYFELPWGSAPVIGAEVNKEAHRIYQVGDPVKIRYLPEKPQVCRVER